jgi:hypothetical protein
MARAIAGMLALLAACGEHSDADVGFGEPLQVDAATFRGGAIPQRDAALDVTSLDAASGVWIVGQRGLTLSGRVDADAYAIATRFADIGTGWWISQVQDLDPQFPDERGFGLSFDLGAAIPPGLRTLEVAPVDRHGRIGTPFELDACVVDDRVPDGLNVCDPELPPPAHVVSLVWDRPADLDLRVRTPTGKVISWKHPTSYGGDGVPDDALDDPTVGVFTRDSNSGCIEDGRNSEAVVWQESPADGPFSIYVDMFESCGVREAIFQVALYRRKTHEDGTFALEQVETRTGTLLDLAADGGAHTALFVLETDLR